MYKNKIDEQYYAQDNTPSFYQFKGKYHFYDTSGRQYMIATKNKQVLQNTRFKNNRRVEPPPLQPVFNNYGQAKLYVKLTSPLVPWFSRSDVNKRIELYENAENGATFVVELKSSEKNSAKRRTGSVYVKGLDQYELNRILLG